MARKRSPKPETPTPTAAELSVGIGPHLEAAPAASEKMFPDEAIRVPPPPFNPEMEERRQKVIDKAKESEARQQRERLAIEHEFFERRWIFIICIVCFCIAALGCSWAALNSNDPTTRAWARDILKIFFSGIGAFVLGRQTAAKKLK